jgi:hypothetical protein
VYCTLAALALRSLVVRGSSLVVHGGAPVPVQPRRQVVLQLHGSDGPRGVALQVAFERHTLKLVFHFIGYRLWVRKAIGYGSWVNLIQRAEPYRGNLLGVEDVQPRRVVPRVVHHRAAVQVAFVKSKGLKPVFHLIGSRVETRRFRALWVNCIQLAQPYHHHHPPVVLVVALQVAFERQIMKPVFHLIGYRL